MLAIGRILLILTTLTLIFLIWGVVSPKNFFKALHIHKIGKFKLSRLTISLWLGLMTILLFTATTVTAFQYDKNVDKIAIVRHPKTSATVKPKQPIIIPAITVPPVPSSSGSNQDTTSQTVTNHSSLASECDKDYATYEQSVQNNRNSVYSQVQTVETQAKANDESALTETNQVNSILNSNNPTVEQYYSTYSSEVNSISGCILYGQEFSYTLLPIPTLPDEPYPGYPG